MNLICRLIPTTTGREANASVALYNSTGWKIIFVCLLIIINAHAYCINIQCEIVIIFCVDQMYHHIMMEWIRQFQS